MAIRSKKALEENEAAALERNTQMQLAQGADASTEALEPSAAQSEASAAPEKSDQNAKKEQTEIETIIVTKSPAIGPAMPTSNSTFLFVMLLRIWIMAPNVGTKNPGTPGMKYGHDALMPWCLAAIM